MSSTFELGLTRQVVYELRQKGAICETGSMCEEDRLVSDNALRGINGMRP